MKKKIYMVMRYMGFDDIWFQVGGENEEFTKKKDAEELMHYHRRDGGTYKVKEVSK